MSNYFFIYDDFVSEKRHEKELHKIETRLTDLGIAGRVARLALFRNAREMVRDEIRHGITTVVAVGNDDTVRKVIDAVAEGGMTFGVIPLGDPNRIAQTLGVPYGVKACDVLSARMIESIDIGVVNGRRFITGVSVPAFSATITCADGCRIAPKETGELSVCNLSTKDVTGKKNKSDPRDGILETEICVGVSVGSMRRKQTKKSWISLRSLKITSDTPVSLFADGGEMVGQEFEIGVQPMGLKLITGRARLF